MNAAMLLMAVRLMGSRARLWRVWLAALSGALIAAGLRGAGLSRGQTALLWLPVASGMMIAACGRKAARHPVRSGMMLLCAAGLLGGTVLALSGATGSLIPAYGLGVLCALLLGVQAIRSRRTAQAVCHVRLICCFRGAEAEFEAMLDSGNTLRDYLTHLPVIVMPEGTGRQRLHLEDTPLRPIFADTAGGKQMMAVLTPQEIRLKAKEEWRTVRAVVALSPGMEDDAPALVPAQLMDGES